MAISAESITKSSTLEQLRTQFNNLVSDLTALEAGKAAFTEITTTTISGTAINVAEDGTIVFEGATNDDFETTLTVVDPTADRTITLPDTTGTVALTSDIPSSGISSGNVATFTSGVADDDFLRVNGTSIEGRSASEVASDIGAATTGDATALAIALG